MTAVTTTPYRSAQSAGRDGFAQLVHAEWTKFRTVRGWLIGTIIAILLMIFVGLTGSTHSSECSTGPNAPTRTGAACLPPIPTGPGGEAVVDAFYVVRQPLTGNGSLTVRVTSLTGLYPPNGTSGPAGPGQSPTAGLKSGLQPWSKAGIIIKANTREGSAYAAMMVTGDHGVRFQYDYVNDVAGLPGRVSAASPRWLRLSRSGDTITGYDSADGQHWTKVGTATLTGLPSTAQAGMFATSPLYAAVSLHFGGSNGSMGPSLATGVFDDVSLRGGSGTPWSGTDVAGRDSPAYVKATVSPFSTGSPVGYHQAGGRFTVTGSGDIAPATNGIIGSGFSAAPIEQHLVGAFAGLIVFLILAAMFITAEYRRGLIRITLAATPRRGRMLAAKAIVVAAVTFVAGLVAAIVSVAIGDHLSHAQGQYVFPTTLLTDLRVVAGMAALLAVAAVMALAIGTMIRRSAVAISAAVVAVILPYILAVAGIVPLGAADWLLRVTPAAGFAIEQSLPQYSQVADIYTPQSGYFPLAPWVGFAVLCCYAAAAMGLAIFLLRRRDA